MARQLPLAFGLMLLALSSGAGARAKDKWGIFKSISDARFDSVVPGPEAGVGTGAGLGSCAQEQESLKDEIALLKGKLAAAKSLAAEAERKLDESRQQTAVLQQQHHSLLQERKTAEEEVARMKIELLQAREALSASHRASKDVMIDYLRALREAEARSVPRQQLYASPSPPSSSAREKDGQTSRAAQSSRRAAQNEAAAELRNGKMGGGTGNEATAARSRLPSGAEGRGRDISARAPSAGQELPQQDEQDDAEDAEELAEIEVKGSEGVLIVKRRELVLNKDGQVEQVALRDIKTVTSSPQGTIKVMGGGGAVLLEGPRLSSFPMDQLGVFFETVKTRVTAAKRKRAQGHAAAEAAPTPTAPPPSAVQAPAAGPLALRGAASEDQVSTSAHGGRADAGQSGMGMEILDEEEEGDEDEGQWELENEAGRDEDGPAGWDRSIHADYDVMQNEFCDDWRRQKGTACPHPTPVNDAHMYLLHGHLACGKRSARNATRSVRKAVALDPGLLMGHNLLAKIYIGQGRFRKAVSHLKKALDIDPTMWEALIQLQFVLHRTGELASALGRDVNEKICTRIGELFRRQGVAGDPASVGLCSFFDTVTWHRPLEQDPSIATRMREHKYVALADILAPPIVAVLQQYYRTIIDTRYKVRFAEKTRRWEFEEAPLANLVNLMLTDLVSRITGQAVVPTYAFPVYYVSGGHIWPHLDVAENEISLTMQLELTPPGAEWPLLLEDPETKALKGISMYDNDGVLYRGTEVVHWRDKMPDEYQVCSLTAKRECDAHTDVAISRHHTDITN